MTTQDESPDNPLSPNPTASPVETPETVSLTIDGQRRAVPSAISGEALYRLARVPYGQCLYRERQDQPDECLDRDAPSLALLRDDRLSAGPAPGVAITIIINGRKREVRERRLTFAQILALEYQPVPSGPDWVFTVTYYNGPRSNPSGSLLEGQSVAIQQGMVFNATATDKS